MILRTSRGWLVLLFVVSAGPEDNHKIAVPDRRAQRRSPTGSVRLHGYASGGDPLPPFRGTPAPRRRDSDPSPAGDRAPPRGVDVKETPAGRPGKPRRGRKTPETAKMGFFAHFRHFRPFWPFLAKMASFCSPATSPARGLLHQPLAAGSCTRQNREKWPDPGYPREKVIFGDFCPKSPFSGFWGLGTPEWFPASRPGDRAPARGVDVKPPPAQGAGTGVPGLQGPGRAQISDPGLREARRALLGPSGGLGTRSGPRAGGCFTSTPRGGALSPAGGPLPGSREPPLLRRRG